MIQPPEQASELWCPMARVAQAGQPYHVAEFRHADDADFCEQAHASAPKLLEYIAELEAQLSAIGAGGVEPLRPATEAPQVQADARDATRYRWLRARDLETICQGGVFAGMTPQNVILNGQDLDDAIDAAIAAQAKQGCAQK